MLSSRCHNNAAPTGVGWSMIEGRRCTFAQKVPRAVMMRAARESVDQPTTPELKLSNLFVQNERPLLLVNQRPSHDRRVSTTLPDSINDAQRSAQVAALKYAQPAGTATGVVEGVNTGLLHVATVGADNDGCSHEC
jgi:hypothetical protein